MTTSPIEAGASAAKSGIAAGAKAAKSTVHAARQAIDAGLDAGHSRAADVLDSARSRADGMLQAAEGVAIAALEGLAHRGQRNVSRVRNRAFEIERSFAPRRGPPVMTALVGLGAGVLLSALLMPRGKSSNGTSAPKP
jgi:hypothetical protein